LTALFENGSTKELLKLRLIIFKDLEDERKINYYLDDFPIGNFAGFPKYVSELVKCVLNKNEVPDLPEVMFRAIVQEDKITLYIKPTMVMNYIINYPEFSTLNMTMSQEDGLYTLKRKERPDIKIQAKDIKISVSDFSGSWYEGFNLVCKSNYDKHRKYFTIHEIDDFHYVITAYKSIQHFYDRISVVSSFSTNEPCDLELTRSIINYHVIKIGDTRMIDYYQVDVENEFKQTFQGCADDVKDEMINILDTDYLFKPPKLNKINPNLFEDFKTRLLKDYRVILSNVKIITKQQAEEVHYMPIIYHEITGVVFPTNAFFQNVKQGRFTDNGSIFILTNKIPNVKIKARKADLQKMSVSMIRFKVQKGQFSKDFVRLMESLEPSVTLFSEFLKFRKVMDNQTKDAFEDILSNIGNLCNTALCAVGSPIQINFDKLTNLKDILQYTMQNKITYNWIELGHIHYSPTRFAVKKDEFMIFVCRDINNDTMENMQEKIEYDKSGGINIPKSRDIMSEKTKKSDTMN
jgi:hypothetical protein